MNLTCRLRPEGRPRGRRHGRRPRGLPSHILDRKESSRNFRSEDGDIDDEYERETKITIRFLSNCDYTTSITVLVGCTVLLLWRRGNLTGRRRRRLLRRRSPLDLSAQCSQAVGSRGRANCK